MIVHEVFNLFAEMPLCRMGAAYKKIPAEALTTNSLGSAIKLVRERTLPRPAYYHNLPTSMGRGGVSKGWQACSR